MYVRYQYNISTVHYFIISNILPVSISVWTWSLTVGADVCEHRAEESVWTQQRESERRMEKAEELHNLHCSNDGELHGRVV